MNNLTGRSRHSPRHCPVSADAIASQLVRNGKYEAVDRKSSRLVSQEVSDLWRVTTPDPVNISDNFSQSEFTSALQHLKPGKALGSDSIFSELILHAGAALKSWLRDFLSSCLRRLKIPKIWRRALVVAITKPAKPVVDPKSYRPISLLCVPYKILERLIYARVEPLIDSLLPKEQAGFQRGKSTVDQVVLLTQNIEDSFEAKKKAGAVFVNLTAAYDTVWHRGLICKLLRLLPDTHMVRMSFSYILCQCNYLFSLQPVVRAPQFKNPGLSYFSNNLYLKAQNRTTSYVITHKLPPTVHSITSEQKKSIQTKFRYLCNNIFAFPTFVY